MEEQKQQTRPTALQLLVCQFIAFTVETFACFTKMLLQLERVSAVLLERWRYHHGKRRTKSVQTTNAMCWIFHYVAWCVTWCPGGGVVRLNNLSYFNTIQKRHVERNFNWVVPGLWKTREGLQKRGTPSALPWPVLNFHHPHHFYCPHIRVQNLMSRLGMIDRLCKII